MQGVFGWEGRRKDVGEVTFFLPDPIPRVVIFTY